MILAWSVGGYLASVLLGQGGVWEWVQEWGCSWVIVSLAVVTLQTKNTDSWLFPWCRITYCVAPNFFNFYVSGRWVFMISLPICALATRHCANTMHLQDCAPLFTRLLCLGPLSTSAPSRLLLILSDPTEISPLRRSQSSMYFPPLHPYQIVIVQTLICMCMFFTKRWIPWGHRIWYSIF